MLVIVGDGSLEKNRVLPEISKKFNGKEKQLFSKLYRLAVPGSSKDFSAPLFGFSEEQV